MSPILFVQWFILLTGAGVGAYFDHRNGKIPNFITIPLILIGIYVSLVYIGTNNIILSGILFFAGPLFKNIGMGDIKILVAAQLLVGNMMGIPIIAWILGSTIILGFFFKNPRLGPKIYYSILFLFLTTISLSLTH